MKDPPLGLERAGLAPGPGRSRPPPRSELGAMTWVTALILAVVGGSAYLGWMWAPVYFDHYAVKQVVRDYMNQAVKNHDDEGLRTRMVQKIRSLAQVEIVDESGRTVRVPSVPIEDGAVTWERDADAQPPMLHVAFTYERQVPYPFTAQTATKEFTVDLTNDLTLPDWGPPR